MADEIDLAQECAENHREMALASALARPARNGRSSGFCVDCNDPIPEARLRSVPGTERCLECQVAAERGSP